MPDQERWKLRCVGGRSLQRQDVRKRIVGDLARVGLVPTTMIWREKDGPVPYEESVVLAKLGGSGPSSFVLASRSPRFEARLSFGDRSNLLFDVPGLAAIDGLGDRLATALVPDFMYAWPRYEGSSSQGRLCALASLINEDAQEPELSTFSGLGFRTWALSRVRRGAAPSRRSSRAEDADEGRHDPDRSRRRPHRRGGRSQWILDVDQ